MNLPEIKEIRGVVTALEKAGFEAYLVGGCVRDLLMEREPKDWDVATNATPDQIQKVFPESVYENEFGTVAVKATRGSTQTDTRINAEENLIVEVTTYRKEGKYTDKRHPDEIKFAQTIEEDLARRDFTVNAIALSLRVPPFWSMPKERDEAISEKIASSVAVGDLPRNDGLTDPFNGQEDIKNKIIRTVGNPEERFNEDALRLMRAVRLAAELDFGIEKKTADAISKMAGLLEMIAKERIRDEFIKMIMTSKAGDGVRMMTESGLLKYVLPELLEGVGVGQNKHHIYNVFDHNVRALEYAVSKNYSLEVRLASLLHDVGKPRTKGGDGPDSTFYNHDLVGAKMTLRALDRLKFPKKLIEKVAHLVRYHLFYYNVGEVSEAGVRRFLRKVGPEHVDDLIKVREADRIGSGVPKAVPYKLRHLLFMIEKVKQDAIDTRMLQVDGDDIKKLTGLPQSIKVGQILAVLLEEVLDDPKKNTKDYLEKHALELNQLSEEELKKMASTAREKKDEFESGKEEEIKKRFFVK